MSGDDKSMDEILSEIREIVAEDRSAEGESANGKARRGQPVRMIGFEAGLLGLAPFAGLALLWGVMLNGWLGIAEPFDSLAGVIALFVLIATVDKTFRQPDDHREWVILLATTLLGHGLHHRHVAH